MQAYPGEPGNPGGRVEDMKNGERVGLILGAVLIVGIAVPGTPDDGLAVDKAVDQRLAPPGAELTYTITVANLANPAVATGLFTDDFPDEVEDCAWTCSETEDAWCEFASGTGDISQLVSVPVGASVRIDATCTFAPSPGFECASNVAEFFTMDPDTITRGFATTCQSGIIVFFDDFESGDTMEWSASVL